MSPSQLQPPYDETDEPKVAGHAITGEEDPQWAGLEGAARSHPTAVDAIPRDSGASVIRALLLLVAFLTIGVIVAVRLVTWQISDNTVRANPPVAQAGEDERGRVLDSVGLLLVTDSFVWEIYAKPAELLGTAEASQLVAELARILGESEKRIRSDLAAGESLVTLAKNVSEDQCQAVRELQHPEKVWCAYQRRRVYPHGALGAHLIGFANYKQQGVSGVEWTYDAWLRSLREDWPTDRLPSSTPEALPEAWKLYLPSRGGQDLVLHMNGALQHLVEKRLADAVQYYKAETGTIIVMDPRTGGILALANVPTFDPNSYSDADEALWGNPAVRDSYEPGSVFKLVTYAAALDTERLTPETRYRDSGSLTVGGRPIRNAERMAYGVVTARQALAKSINVVAARICLDMGADTFYRYVHQFGFGRLTEVDLNYEGEGIVKSPGNPNWSQYDQAANSYGQGIAVTALQMLNAVAAIANKGTLLQPQVAMGLLKDGQVYRFPPRVMRQVLKPETARTLTQMMVYDIESSSNPNPVPGFRVAGKTGTAEIPTEQGYTSQEVITSFAGFLPAADPQIVVLVKLVKPSRSRWAEFVAVPVFTRVAQDAVQILGIQPDDRMP